MIIMSSNLLAEKPYSKYCKTARLEFEFRKLRFLELIRAEAPEIMLLQEVDPAWREALISNLRLLGYEVVFGECWSSGLAVAWRSTSFKSLGNWASDSEAGLLVGKLQSLSAERKLTVINLHAPWGKASIRAAAYNQYLVADGSIVVGGDFNTDNPETNTNLTFFMSNYFSEQLQFSEATKMLDFTARNVNTNHPEKLDYIVMKGLVSSGAKAIPSSVQLLLPHADGAHFSPENKDNHFSDHAAVLVTWDWL